MPTSSSTPTPPNHTPKATLGSISSTQTPNPQSSDDLTAKRTAEQNAQARLVLIQLLWLAVIILLGLIAWLANTQKQLALHVEERLKITDSFNARMNDVDDRLFAINNQETKSVPPTHAQNDLQFVSIHLMSADRLYQAGDYQASSEVLRLLEWQLESNHLALATPLISALKTAIKDDLVHLNAMDSQIDPWQADIMTMRRVQSFLRGFDTGGSLTQKELALHDANVFLSLAIGAGALRERETQVTYLSDTLASLESLKRFIPKSTDAPKDDQENPMDDQAPITSLEQSIFVLNKLLANPPSLTPLKSRELLKNY